MKKNRLRRPELVQPLLDEHAVGAEVDVLAALEDAADQLADLRIDHRLAAADADDRRAALVHRGQALLDGELLLDGVCEYSRMRPQPVQVRLQACSGSSISTSGKALLRR